MKRQSRTRPSEKATLLKANRARCDAKRAALRARMKARNQSEPGTPLFKTKRHGRWASRKLQIQAMERVAVYMKRVAGRLKRAEPQKRRSITPEIKKRLQTLSESKRDRLEKHDKCKHLIMEPQF